MKTHRYAEPKLTKAYLSVRGEFKSLLLSLMFIAGSGPAMAVPPATSCSESTFSGLQSPEGTLVHPLDLVEQVPAGPTNVEFCRIRAHILTSASPIAGDKEISIEIRLPTQWNQRYMQYGGSGLDGTGVGSTVPDRNFAPLSGFAYSLFGNNLPITVSDVTSPPLDPLTRGYAIAATNAGHISANGLNTDASWLLSLSGPNSQNGLDRWNNYTYRARHLLAVTAKNAINLYYNQAPIYSYHVGVSNGGRNGLMEASIYPQDFNGILAFAPPTYQFGGLTASWLRVLKLQFPVNLANPTIPIDLSPVPGPLLQALGNATMAKCDSSDGLIDGIVSNPSACDFNVDTDVPQCAGDLPGPSCFTSAQREVLKAFYTPTVLNGNIVSPAFLPGYEGDPASQIAFYALGGGGLPVPYSYLFTEQGLKYTIFGDPSRNIWNVDLSNPIDVNALFNPPSGYDPNLFVPDPDLSAFKAAGGKLIIMHGFSDTLLSATATIDYYKAVEQALGGLSNTRDFARLFLLPGIGHLARPTAAGVPSPTDYIAPLEQWVEQGIAPDSLAGSNTNPTLITRPICAYPYKAVYVGPTGDTVAMKVANNFQCRFYDFGGFLSPVANLPAVNVVKAGQGVPVKFSLGGNWGLNIFAVGQPISVRINCNSGTLENTANTVSAGNSSLQYDATTGHYTYVWKTDKSWSGTCRQLQMRLNEGTLLKANFRFN